MEARGIVFRSKGKKRRKRKSSNEGIEPFEERKDQVESGPKYQINGKKDGEHDVERFHAHPRASSVPLHADGVRRARIARRGHAIAGFRIAALLAVAKRTVRLAVRIGFANVDHHAALVGVQTVDLHDIAAAVVTRSLGRGKVGTGTRPGDAFARCARRESFAPIAPIAGAIRICDAFGASAQGRIADRKTIIGLASVRPERASSVVRKALGARGAPVRRGIGNGVQSNAIVDGRAFYAHLSRFVPSQFRFDGTGRSGVYAQTFHAFHPVTYAIDPRLAFHAQPSGFVAQAGQARDFARLRTGSGTDVARSIGPAERRALCRRRVAVAVGSAFGSVARPIGFVARPSLAENGIVARQTGRIGGKARSRNAPEVSSAPGGGRVAARDGRIALRAGGRDGIAGGDRRVLARAGRVGGAHAVRERNDLSGGRSFVAFPELVVRTDFQTSFDPVADVALFAEERYPRRTAIACRDVARSCDGTFGHRRGPVGQRPGQSAERALVRRQYHGGERIVRRQENGGQENVRRPRAAIIVVRAAFRDGQESNVPIGGGRIVETEDEPVRPTVNHVRFVASGRVQLEFREPTREVRDRRSGGDARRQRQK